ncbi:Guanine nucleotide exchange factor lte1 [Ascochyta rabiei]|uniref:Guanine nucleotide exchange factor lte1 n=1 Tax=Didymella rabiei TaxID=5454 RepID=UPI0018FF7EBA|nr:Guanine nucleotide exchange factor lte1 [Ascochyta rabiei]UPX09844.1 Guanine nucleotide exchange factor lte1 [Ascochyta rabiei]
MAVLQPNAHPGSPAPGAGQRDLFAGAQTTDTAPRRADDQRRLRRVKDSKEQLKRRNQARGTSNGTIDTSTSNSTSAGRSYTVANVHNGVIYLRPVVRAGNQRNLPQPDPFIFPPQTPPDSATLDTKLRPTSNEWEQSLYGSRTPRSEPTPPLPPDLLTEYEARQQAHAQHPSTSRPIAHPRAHSFSTLDGHTTTSATTEPGTFKVVIERPPFGARPKTADTSSLPLLQVPIPHYRLGTPRFSTKGTVDLRSSTYTRTSATDEFRNSLLTPQRVASHSFLSSRPQSDAFSPVPARYRATMDRPPLPASAPSSSRVSHAPIGPRLYDALTANPDDRAVVKFSPSGEILAATPSRLVAHITSPSFLDYELLSDFFLTFRAFLSTRDLVAYLIARLRWAVDRQDDFGRIVRVRTFVALRHWILNYFVDDFVPSHHLRTYFCNLVNGLYRDLKTRADGGAGDVKIVGELKKCWRRTCVLYWETEEGLGKDFADEELLPGGLVELPATYEEPEELATRPATPRRVDRDTKETMGSNPSDQFASRHMDWAQRARHTPQNSLSSPYVPSNEAETVQAPLSPSSEGSMHVLSCSLPRRGFLKSEQAMDLPLYPHPVPHPSTAPARLATSPQQPVSNKNTRPSHTHKRSGSFSDALRDSRAPLSIPKNASVDVTISAVTSMPGSLVRGGLFQPSSPYVELKGTSLRHTRSRSETDGDDMYADDLQLRPGHANSPGMKKILGSMRRALSIKQSPHSSPQLGPHVHQRMVPPMRCSNPGTLSTTSGGVRKQRTIRTRPEIRIDALASKVVESFKEAVEQQLREEDQRRESSVEPPDLGGFEFEFENRKASSTGEDDKLSRSPDPRVYSNITTGSKSILIIDDTGPPPLPVMSEALPSAASDETRITSTPPKSLQRNPSIAQRLAEGGMVAVRHSDLYKDPTPTVSVEERRMSRSSTQQSQAPQRRSTSEGRGQMHSFQRRDSMRKSLARYSLRRHVSYNSILSRHRQGPESVATFMTMSSDNDPFFLERQAPQAPHGPGRMLRRKPGGDLRAAGNIQDLEMTPRPHSTGSISNRTHSIANSVILRSDRYAAPAPDASQPAEAVDETVVVRKPISLVETHSSQPNLRPSFEAEVAKLAALPDDTDDEGGVEAALMKLEGRYEKKSPRESSVRAPVVQPEVYWPTGAPGDLTIPPYKPKKTEELGGADDSLHRPLATPGAEGQNMYHLSGENFNRRVPAVVSTAAESEDSYSSVPLLDRDLSDVIAAGRTQTFDTMRSSAKPSPLQLTDNTTAQTTASATNPTSANPSLEYAVETDSVKRIRSGNTLPSSTAIRQSFLLDEDEELSDIASTTTVARSDEASHGVRTFFEDEPAAIDRASDNFPTHPMRHPPTPPSTADRLKEAAPSTTWDRGLPTPGLTPTASRPDQSNQHTPDQHIKLHESQFKQPVSTAHLPFILAYDAELIAQQFTVVEKDALDEIDWKELVELRWKQSSPQIRDWVHYLRTQEARGVDVVIARFNLVVKWAVSECVLTENIEERARCIIKYIHIASHARRLRNYATMYQIAIALISNDVARLHKTWALVPTAEKQTMKELEALVQPLRNFHNLRLEMETATVEDGCIPFIGIYTRDLIYNAQKPPFIDAPPVDGERLVNFERHHTAATIVKNLLRLLEASSRYSFRVDPDLISKCLWLAALSDDELAKRSRQCE